METCQSSQLNHNLMSEMHEIAKNDRHNMIWTKKNLCCSQWNKCRKINPASKNYKQLWLGKFILVGQLNYSMKVLAYHWTVRLSFPPFQCLKIVRSTNFVSFRSVDPRSFGLYNREIFGRARFYQGRSVVSLDTITSLTKKGKKGRMVFQVHTLCDILTPHIS